MAYFLPAQINCLDSQVEAYTAAHTKAMECFDVEELVSLFVSLAAEMEKSATKGDAPGAARQATIAEFKQLVSVGGRIRDMVRRLRDDGYVVAGTDDLLRSLIRCRAAADSDDIAADRDRVTRGEIKTRPVQELIDELQRRDSTAGR
jgi:hypothetical protein